MPRPALLLFLLPALLAAACHKEPVAPDEPPVCEQVATAPAEFLQHWFFPVGSYWVYHRLGSRPLEVDTVRVVLAEKRVFRPGANTYGQPTCTELFETVLEHSNRAVFREHNGPNSPRGTERLYSQEESGEWFAIQYSQANLNPLGFMWSYPPHPVGGPIANTGPILLDTLPVTVPAGSFQRSSHMRLAYFPDSTRSGGFLYDYHLTRGIGYTRLRYANFGTWELASYHLAN